MVAPRGYQAWSLAAAAWCVAFGVLSLYWAAGGTLGVNQLAASLTWLLGGVLFLMTAWTFTAERNRGG
jgi:hypothetical protein